MDMIVRPATRADGDAILALMPRLAAFDLPESRNPEHLWMHDAALLRKWLAGEADTCRIQVADAGAGQIVGLAMVSLRPELLSLEPSAHLEALAVAPGFEGQGLGHRLIDAAEADARANGAETMTLHVFAVNTRARRLYERAGYDGELMRYIKPLADSSEPDGG